MEEIISIFTNIRRVRAFIKDNNISLATINEMIDKLSSVRDNLRDELEADEKVRQEKLDKLEKYREMLKEDGISIDDLLAVPFVANERKKRKPKTPKYEYTSNGEYKTWTGQGRMPLPISDAIASEGKTLDDFLIKHQM